MNLWNSFPEAGQWLLKSSAQAAVLVLVVLAVQRLFRRHLPARWRHALWWLVVIRLVLPASPASVFSLFHWAGWRAAKPVAAQSSYTPGTLSEARSPRLASPARFAPVPGRAEGEPVVDPSLLPAAATRLAPASVVVADSRPAPVAVPARPATRLTWLWFLGGLWLAGVAALTARLGFALRQFRRALARTTPLVDPVALGILEQSRALAGLRYRPAVLETDAISTPAVYGLWRPCLLLPPGLVSRFSAAELRLVFLHELAHLKRRDLAVNWLTTVLQILHWFNPLLWFAFHRMRADSELACDAAALDAAGAGEHRTYGAAIIKVLEGVGGRSLLPGVAGIAEDRNQMRNRIRMIALFRPTRHRAWAAGLAGVALGWVCLTDAPAPKSEAGPAPGATVRSGSSTPTPAESAAGESSRELRVGTDPTPAVESAPAGIGELTVTVRDAADGKALPGAEVFAPHIGNWQKPQPRRRTDVDGRYVLRFPLPPVEGRREMSSFGISANHVEYAQHAVMWTSSGGDVYAGMPKEITLVLERGTTIGGRVEDEAGAPVAGVRVLLSGSGYHGFTMGTNDRQTHEYAEIQATDLTAPAAVTDADGRWSYARFPAALDYVELTLVRPDGSQQKFSTKPEHMNVNSYPLIRIEELRASAAVAKLPEGLTVRGIVVDEAGQPLAGATVTEGYGHGNIVRVSEFTTGADGRFERPHRVPRQWIYTASRPDRATVSVVAQVELEMGDVRIVLPPAKPLRFVVVNEPATPVANVQLSIDPHRTEGQLLDWSGTTDADGTATWTNAPTAPVTFYALSKDPPVSRKFKTVPGEPERRVVLSAAGADQVKVRMTVRDAASHNDVKVSRVTANFEGGGTPYRTVAEPDAAEFTVPLNRSDVRVGMYPSYRLRIEAAGYEPLTTDSFDFDEGNQELQLTLQRSGGPSEWKVLLPDGSPAAGAKLWVQAGTDHQPLFINAPGRYYGDRLARAQADDSGLVKPPASAASVPVVIAHPRGFLASTAGELRRRAEVRLEPYGSVQGRLLVAGKPKGGVNLSLSTLAWAPSIPFHLSYTATTAKDGTFDFSEVPAGEYKLYRWQVPKRQMRGGGFAITETCQWPLKVTAGDTTRVEYAFRGRPVVGQLVPEPLDAAVDWQNDVHVLALKAPAADAVLKVNREDFASFAAFLKAHEASFGSDSRVAEARAARTFQLAVETDGTFRVEDVPPGNYELRVRVTKPAEGAPSSPFPRAEEEIGSLTRKVQVSAGSEPIDLGTLTVGIKGETVKAPPMDFLAESFEGRPVGFREVKGPRLVVFWAAWSDRSREALESLKRIAGEPGTPSGVTIIGVNLDEDLESARTVVREGGYGWLQTRLSAEERGRLAAAFDVTQLPAIFLVNAQGRIVNRDLEGERLRAALNRVSEK